MILLAVLSFVWPTATWAQAPDSAVAIVVHLGTSVEDLTMDQLRRIFLAEQQFWPDNSRITLLVRAPGAYERELVLDRIYRMDEDRFRQYWIAKMFRAEVPSGPKIVFSSNMALELVTAIPGSITFMNSTEISDSVKVVRIDGLLPNDAGYPLR
jgi:ABC-type phosphate transport system substrate-binding protein